MKNKLTSLCLAAAMVTMFTVSKANNLTITTFTVSATNVATFNIAWENSWNVSTSPTNWDAVWVFIKYKDCSVTDFTWLHADMAATGHTAGAPLQVDVVTDNKGVFIRRSAVGSGTVTATVSLNLNVPAGTWDFKVFGIEMVYVPIGDFSIGDLPNSPTSFNAATITNTEENVTSMTAAALGGGAAGPVPLAYPMGYNPFYQMKYEITQQQYADFLNVLLYTQQATRTAIAPNSAVGSVAMGSITYRQRIYISTSGLMATTPAVYTAFYSVNNANNVACNLLSWSDIAAYLDWAALRPMSDLEFEKACRGTDPLVGGEYAWGSILYTLSTGPTNPFLDNEVSSVSGNGLVNAVNNTGAFRVGFAATATTSRLSSGSTFYGALDMSGNLLERVVAVNAAGLSFTGTLGDGVLNSIGDADAPSWPGTNAVGSGSRGGNLISIITNCRTSDRTLAATTGATRVNVSGGRGVRDF